MDTAALGDLVTAGFQKLGFIRYAGITGEEFALGRYVVAMTPGADHLNHNGDLHAAVLFGLAETAAMGAAVSAVGDRMGESFIVARDGRITYRARAKGQQGPFRAAGELGTELVERLRAAVAATEPIEVEVPVALSDAAGTTVAEAAFTAVIRPRRT